jgi:hypothetical protein
MHSAKSWRTWNTLWRSITCITTLPDSSDLARYPGNGSWSCRPRLGVVGGYRTARLASVPKSLKPAFDALDFSIGAAANIATLRGQLTALREQADAIESEREIFQAERDDFKAQLDQAKQEISRLENEIREWQQQKSEDQRMAEERGFWPGS